MVQNWTWRRETNAKEHRNYGRRRIENVLVEEAARLEVRKHFFNVRAARTWNSIPDKVRNQKSLNSFKTAYDNWKRKEKTIDSSTSEAPEAPMAVSWRWKKNEERQIDDLGSPWIGNRHTHHSDITIRRPRHVDNRVCLGALISHLISSHHHFHYYHHYHHHHNCYYY